MKNKEIAKKCGDSTILSGHRNIGTGIYTDVFGGLRERKKSLKEIFNEIWPLARNQLSEFKRKYMSTWIVFFYIHIFL